jgi:hypothetical protein
VPRLAPQQRNHLFCPVGAAGRMPGYILGRLKQFAPAAVADLLTAEGFADRGEDWIPTRGSSPSLVSTIKW